MVSLANRRLMMLLKRQSKNITKKIRTIIIVLQISDVIAKSYINKMK